MPTNDHESLLAAWNSLLPGQDAMGEMLIARYSEPHRRYHNTAHLAQMLTWVDDFATADNDLFLVRLATWFHDAVYDLPEGQLSNEEASVRLSRRELGRAGFEQEDLNEVARLIRLTTDHLPGTHDPDGDLICDADLAILAAEPEDYRAYVEAVRAEYASVTDLDFAQGRLEILEELLDTALFRTPRGRRLKSRAISNLEAECATLREIAGIE